MWNAPLNLQCADPRVAATIMSFTQGALFEAHCLMCTMPIPMPGAPAVLPHTFNRPAAVMLLMAIAATSTIRYFDPKTNTSAKKPGDKDKFTDCLLKFFPWGSVRGVDLDAEAAGLAMPPAEEHENAANKMYSLLRNPLMHSGGAVGSGFPRLHLSGQFPGLASFAENDRDLSEYCALPDLKGQRFLAYRSTAVVLENRPLYWAVRRMIENFAAEPDVQANITARLL